MSEKKFEEPAVSNDADYAVGSVRRASASRRKSSAVNPEILRGEIFDERYETTQRGLKSRHAQMIALGGTIGTGLFVGSGQTLARGGPAFILSAYCFMSFLIFCTVAGIIEVAAYLPTPGASMNLFGYRYVSRSMGFGLGWLYFYSLGILVPYEITAAGLVIEYWNPPVNIAVWITIMIIVIVGLNCFPVKFYGETEFWFAGVKVVMILGLLFLSFILFWGGGPSHDRLGFRYWKNPGAANEYLETGNTGRFVALLSTVVLSAFPFSFAPELLVATGGEMQSPRRNLPTAARRYIYRLVIFYVCSVLAIGVICPSNDEKITSGGHGAGASPFVVGIKNAGIPALDSIINAGIIISAWSSGNSFLFLSSRSLYGLALSGNAPKIFKTCSKKGVPYYAVACSSLFCALAYLNVGSSSAVVFNWFVNLTNTSGFISWICCGIIYLRFRKAREAQNVTELPYTSPVGKWGAYTIIVSFTFLCLINGFDVFWSENWNISSFFTAYVGIPMFFLFYGGHRIWAWHDQWAYDPMEVDLYTGLEEILAQEVPQRKMTGPWWKKITLIWQ
ncbi:amino acid permease/ SLC12A domain-containing protein [Paraphoma chrysanthemicola]|uniref:Amino acid permease/ SLC12A domain-containing protein n=1 Tax=Paraphoma chrysanthemicola TaxID=798071 RepID=A0A8K0VUH1_9PLEO|nr:amino acid permease/ SLC12A domain-containing protein [Paraphoma chrysanthemicola]